MRKIQPVESDLGSESESNFEDYYKTWTQETARHRKINPRSDTTIWERPRVVDSHGAEGCNYNRPVESTASMDRIITWVSTKLAGRYLVASQQFVPDRLRKMIAKRNIGIARVSGLINTIRTRGIQQLRFLVNTRSGIWPHTFPGQTHATRQLHPKWFKSTSSRTRRRNNQGEATERNKKIGSIPSDRYLWGPPGGHFRRIIQSLRIKRWTFKRNVNSTSLISSIPSGQDRYHTQGCWTSSIAAKRTPKELHWGTEW